MSASVEVFADYRALCDESSLVQSMSGMISSDEMIRVRAFLSENHEPGKTRWPDKMVPTEFEETSPWTRCRSSPHIAIAALDQLNAKDCVKFYDRDQRLLGLRWRSKPQRNTSNPTPRKTNPIVQSWTAKKSTENAAMNTMVNNRPARTDTTLLQQGAE